MEFEFDAAKSYSNKTKHDIDFTTAQLLWDDLSRIEVVSLGFEEPRHQVIGSIGDRVWSAIITHRNNKIRIISVRRARANEEKQYHGR